MSEPTKKPKKKLLPAHISRPITNCKCLMCQEHRRRDKEALRDRALAAMYATMEGPLSVRLAANATAALRDALGA